MVSKHILVVESNPDDAFLIRRAFTDLPFCTSFLCQSLSEAKAYLSRAGIYSDVEKYPDVDAIITELRLGGDSGSELLNWMRERENLDSIPVFVLAGVISPQDRSALNDVGIKRAVEKPSETREFKRVLRDMAQEVCGGN